MKYFLFAVFITTPLIMGAKEVIIINQSTHEPIENVAVYNKDKSKTTISNSHGIIYLNVFSETDSIYFQHASFLHYVAGYNQLKEKGEVLLTRKVIIMPEFVVTASKYKETQRDIPHMADVITMDEINFSSAQTSSDILTTTGNVFVQKSQGGGGSPVLRGFEANKVLLVVDGVTMNNAIYRGGHLQNSITLDNNILEKTEIVYGPNAIMYGSDALGGVIHYITRNPDLASDDEKLKVSANAQTQAATANSSWKNHFDFSIGTKRFGSLTSISHSDYGDIKMGSRRDPYLGDYGRCHSYIETVNGIDSIIHNSNSQIQKNTGFSQLDLLQKFRYKHSDKHDLIANLQYSTSSDIPRYDMLNDTTDNGDLKYATWNYGPQKRFLSSVKSLYRAGYLFADDITTIAAYQYIEESRITRKYRNLEQTTQREQLHIYSLGIDALKRINPRHRLIYGFETHINKVDSRAHLFNIDTGEKMNTQSRYPDEGSATSSYAGYISVRGKLARRWKYEIGGRYNLTHLKSVYSDSVTNIPYKSLDINNSAYTGSAGIIYLPSESTKYNLLISTGYRIPNLDDLAKIRVKSGQITFPNPEVNPEYTYNGELGVSKTFDGYLQINLNYFASYLTDVIVRVPHVFEDGADTMYYDNEWLAAYKNDNSNRGIIHGFSGNIVSDLNSNISFTATLNYTYGRDITSNSPLAHIPPVFGRTELVYKAKRFTQGFSFMYSGWKRMEEMAITGEDNEEEATEYGYPGWYTLNLTSNYIISKHVSLMFAIDNVTNNFYRPFASAVAAPGINFIGTLRLTI